MNKIVAYIVAFLACVFYYVAVMLVSAYLGCNFSRLGTLWKTLLLSPVFIIWGAIVGLAKKNDKEDNKKEEENKEE